MSYYCHQATHQTQPVENEYLHFCLCAGQGQAGAVSRLVLSVMMPEAEQSVLSCDQLCGSVTRLLNSLGSLASHLTLPL